MVRTHKSAPVNPSIPTLRCYSGMKQVLASLAASEKIVDATKSRDILVFRNKKNNFDKRFDGHRKLATGRGKPL